MIRRKRGGLDVSRAYLCDWVLFFPSLLSFQPSYFALALLFQDPIFKSAPKPRVP